MHLKRRNSLPPDISALDALNDYIWQRHLAEKVVDFFTIKLIFYDKSRIFQLSEFVRTLRSSFLSIFFS